MFSSRYQTSTWEKSPVAEVYMQLSLFSLFRVDEKVPFVGFCNSIVSMATRRLIPSVYGQELKVQRLVSDCEMDSNKYVRTNMFLLSPINQVTMSGHSPRYSYPWMLIGLVFWPVSFYFMVVSEERWNEIRRLERTMRNGTWQMGNEVMWSGERVKEGMVEGALFVYDLNCLSLIKGRYKKHT